jgi:hypothetical protein
MKDKFRIRFEQKSWAVEYRFSWFDWRPCANILYRTKAGAQIVLDGLKAGEAQADWFNPKKEAKQ